MDAKPHLKVKLDNISQLELQFLAHFINNMSAVSFSMHVGVFMYVNRNCGSLFQNAVHLESRSYYFWLIIETVCVTYISIGRYELLRMSQK